MFLTVTNVFVFLMSVSRFYRFFNDFVNFNDFNGFNGFLTVLTVLTRFSETKPFFLRFFGFSETKAFSKRLLNYFVQNNLKVFC